LLCSVGVTVTLNGAPELACTGPLATTLVTLRSAIPMTGTVVIVDPSVSLAPFVSTTWSVVDSVVVASKSWNDSPVQVTGNVCVGIGVATDTGRLTLSSKGLTGVVQSAGRDSPILTSTGPSSGPLLCRVVSTMTLNGTPVFALGGPVSVTLTTLWSTVRIIAVVAAADVCVLFSGFGSPASGSSIATVAVAVMLWNEWLMQAT
jgi:hypothetical protein